MYFFLLMIHVDWIQPNSLKQSNSKHTVPSSNMFYRVLWNLVLSLHMSYHALSPVLHPHPGLSYIHTYTHTHTYTYTYTYKQTGCLRTILNVPYTVLVQVCPYLTALSVYLAINRPQGHRLSVCCIKWPGQEGHNHWGFFVCHLLLLCILLL